MSRVANAMVALCAFLLAACESKPLGPPVHALVMHVDSADVPVVRHMSDSIYWYSGFRPDTIALRSDTLMVHMPPGTLGAHLELREDGCEMGTAPYGIVRTVAQHAYRNFGSTRGVRMVVITIPGMEAERSGMFDRGSLFYTVGCSSATSIVQFGAWELQGSIADAGAPRAVCSSATRTPARACDSDRVTPAKVAR